MIFSELADNLTGRKHPLYALQDTLTARGKKVVDLVRGNAGEHGMVFPQDILQKILLTAADCARIYCPDPFGQRTARQSIAAYYRTLNLSPDQILLTPGTSISYLYCFKLLAEKQEQILCPLPSYPLLDYIAGISGVELTYYRLCEDKDWSIDFDHLSRQITSKTRAIVLISPHNPTGHVSSQSEIEDLCRLAGKHDLPVIADEVFAEFLFDAAELARPAETEAPLVFTLNGFSKTFALPGLKLGWIAVSGKQDLVERALNSLEMISDTFLPVSEITQFATPHIFADGQDFLKTYTGWVKQARNLALEKLAGIPLAAPQGGFYLTLTVREDEEKLALALLEQEQILVHPGYFYEMDNNHLVLSFIQDQDCLKDCLQRLRAYL